MGGGGSLSITLFFLLISFEGGVVKSKIPTAQGTDSNVSKNSTRATAPVLNSLIYARGCFLRGDKAIRPCVVGVSLQIWKVELALPKSRGRSASSHS